MFSIIVTGTFLGLSAGLSPGPLMTIVVAKTLQHGTREGIKASFAPLITDAPIIAATLLFLKPVAHLDPILGMLALAGAALLFYLGHENWTAPLPDQIQNVEAGSSIRQAALVNIFSPNPWLFWLTVGAPVLHEEGAKHPAYPFLFLIFFYMLLLGSKTVIACSLGIYGRFLKDKQRILVMRLLSCILFIYAFILLWKARGLLF